MGLLRKRNWLQNVFLSRITLLVVVCLCAALSFAVYDRYVMERQVAERRAEKEKELSTFTERKEEMARKIEYMRGENGLEAEIRQHFDVAQEGERVIVLTGEDKVAEEPRPKSEESSESWWRRVLP